MTHFTGRTRNTNTGAVLTSVVLNATTSTLISAVNEERQMITIINDSSQDVWIKFQAASVDNDKKGIMLWKRSTYEMPVDNVYLGEISAISVSGTPEIFITEY